MTVSNVETTEKSCKITAVCSMWGHFTYQQFASILLRWKWSWKILLSEKAHDFQPVIPLRILFFSFEIIFSSIAYSHLPTHTLQSPAEQFQGDVRNDQWYALWPCSPVLKRWPCGWKLTYPNSHKRQRSQLTSQHREIQLVKHLSSHLAFISFWECNTQEKAGPEEIWGQSVISTTHRVMLS